MEEVVHNETRSREVGRRHEMQQMDWNRWKKINETRLKKFHHETRRTADVRRCEMQQTERRRWNKINKTKQRLRTINRQQEEVSKQHKTDRRWKKMRTGTDGQATMEDKLRNKF